MWIISWDAVFVMKTDADNHILSYIYTILIKQFVICIEPVNLVNSWSWYVGKIVKLKWHILNANIAKQICISSTFGQLI